jgi:peptide/nickel transport system permease protein
MTIAAPDPHALPAIADDAFEIHRSRLRTVLNFCSLQPLGTFGMIIVVIMAVAELFAEWVAPYSPTANDFAAMTEAPSRAHWLGTDQFGRDLLSSSIFGARTALIVGFSCAIIASVAGLVLGVGTAYFGGRFDL